MHRFVNTGWLGLCRRKPQSFLHCPCGSGDELGPVGRKQPVSWGGGVLKLWGAEGAPWPTCHPEGKDVRRLRPYAWGQVAMSLTHQELSVSGCLSSATAALVIF